MSSVYVDVGDLAQEIVDEFDAPVDRILTVGLSDDEQIVYGSLISGNNFFNYATDGNFIGIQEMPEVTASLNEFAHGFLDDGENSAKLDSVPSDEMYSWAAGYFRLDSAVRCKSGGDRCGKICLPPGHICRKARSSRGGAKKTRTRLKQTRAALKSPGGGTGVKTALAVGAGAVAAGVVVANRKQLRAGAKRIGEVIKQTSEGISQETKAGFFQAKEALKEGRNNVKTSVKTLGRAGLGRDETTRVAAGLNVGGVGASLGVVAGTAQNVGRKTGEGLAQVRKEIVETAKDVATNTKALFMGAEKKTVSAPASQEVSAPASQEVSAPTKRKRGRPKKAESSEAETPPKRKRGRPRKNPE